MIIWLLVTRFPMDWRDFFPICVEPDTKKHAKGREIKIYGARKFRALYCYTPAKNVLQISLSLSCAHIQSPPNTLPPIPPYYFKHTYIHIDTGHHIPLPLIYIYIHSSIAYIARLINIGWRNFPAPKKIDLTHIPLLYNIRLPFLSI